MSIPSEGWRPLDEAPHNGDIIVVKGREWGKKSNPEIVNYAQWSCDNKGEGWGWRKAFSMGEGTLWADVWMPYSEFLLLAQRPTMPLFDPQKDFDL